MRDKFTLLGLIVNLLITTSFLSYLAVHVEAQDKSLVVGSTPNLGTLLLVAKHHGFYSSNGLTVDYQKFQTGKTTMDALISGDIEVGAIVDSNVAFINYSSNPVKVIASIGVKTDHAIYFQKNKNIFSPKDLIGKRIGYIPATTSHIFLARFLEHNKIGWSDIKPVVLQPPAMEAALRNDAVDAVSIWEPWGNNIVLSMKETVGVFDNYSDLYPSRSLLATTDKVISTKPQEIKNLLSALRQAEEIYRKSPESTYTFLAPEFGAPVDQMGKVLRRSHFTVTKGSSGLLLVNEIGRWIELSQESFKGKSLPDYNKAFDDRFVTESEDFSSNSTTAAQEVSFCRPNNMVSALPYIADNQKFFEKHGLNIKFETATNAKICQDMLLARKTDYMSGAEGPFTYLAASNPPIKILAMLQQNPETSVFGRKDKGISKFEDLKGKRVAYLPGTVSYFFLARVMKKYNLSRSDMKLTAMQPPTMPTALIGGSIDAFSIWEPWGTQAAVQMPNDVINLTDIELYQCEALLSARVDALEQHPDIPVKILRALLDAEKFIESHNEEAFSILSKSIVFEPTAFKKLWSQYKHKVRIENNSLELMKANFELLKEDDFNFKGSPTPNFRSFVDSSFLKHVSPERAEF